MKIDVDITKIIDAPIDNGNYLNNRKMMRLKQELLKGNPTSYLVSGYRGVGKTSFVKTLINELKLEITPNQEQKVMNSDTDTVSKKKISLFPKKSRKLSGTEQKKKIFIHINIGKYNGFSNLLRSLIREIYWGITNSSEDLRKSVKNSNDLYSQIELIYARTFQEIEFKENYSEKKEKSIDFNLSFNFRNVITRVSTFLLGSLTFINYIKDKKWYSYVIPATLLLGMLLSIEYFKKKNTTSINELNRKTFYDDEVAEFQLTRIISKLNDIGIEFVFVIDELDKIEKEEELYNLISDFKPLILLGKSNFILIFGQKMLYKYLMADNFDNNILSSIFTRNVHIPLLNKNEFERYFINLIGENQYENDLVKKYLDSKILLSNRVFRKFISSIRNDIRFDENNKTFIELNNDDKIMLTNANISLIVYQVEEEIIEATEEVFEEGIRDFLISHLYIAINNMKRYRRISFGIDDILKNKSFIDDDFASGYLNYIRDNIQSLIDKMVTNRLLEVEELDFHDNKKEEVSLSRYKWTENAVLEKIKINNTYGFLDEYIKFERWLRDLSYQALKYIRNKPYKENNSAVQIINVMRKEEIISSNIYEEFLIISKIRNKIVHGEELTDSQKESLISYSNDLNWYKSEIFKEVMISAVRSFNKEYNQSRHIHYVEYELADIVVRSVAFEFLVAKSEDYVKKVVNNTLIKWKDSINNNIDELRIIILIESQVEISKLSDEIDRMLILSKIKVQLIKEVSLFELQDYLKIKHIENV